MFFKKRSRPLKGTNQTAQILLFMGWTSSPANPNMTKLKKAERFWVVTSGLHKVARIHLRSLEGKKSAAHLIQRLCTNAARHINNNCTLLCAKSYYVLPRVWESSHFSNFCHILRCLLLRPKTAQRSTGLTNMQTWTMWHVLGSLSKTKCYDWSWRSFHIFIPHTVFLQVYVIFGHTTWLVDLPRACLKESHWSFGRFWLRLNLQIYAAYPWRKWANASVKFCTWSADKTKCSRQEFGKFQKNKTIQNNENMMKKTSWEVVVFGPENFWETLG